jgi:hypothetical protein
MVASRKSKRLSRKAKRSSTRRRQRGGETSVTLYFNVTNGTAANSIQLVGHKGAPDSIGKTTTWMVPTADGKAFNQGKLQFPSTAPSGVTNFAVYTTTKAAPTSDADWKAQRLGVAGIAGAFSTEPQLSAVSASRRSVTTPLNIPVNLPNLKLNNLWTGLNFSSTAATAPKAVNIKYDAPTPIIDGGKANLKICFTIP